MKLYHGTSEKYLDQILREGLTPRAKRKSNWKEHPSATDRVYLTEAYAIYFAVAATAKGDRGVVLEVSVDPSKLIADEDAIASATLSDPDFVYLNDLSLAERTRFWKKNAPKYPHLAEASLARLGNAAHVGVILPYQISKFVTFDIVPEIVFGHDPSITPLNFRLCGEAYKKALRSFVETDGKEGRVVRPFDDLWSKVS